MEQRKLYEIHFAFYSAHRVFVRIVLSGVTLAGCDTEMKEVYKEFWYESLLENQEGDIEK